MISYPRVGYEAIVRSGLCSCCAANAIKRIDIETDCFRGNDDVLKVCPSHLSMARQHEWKALFDDRIAEKSRRLMPAPRGAT